MKAKKDVPRPVQIPLAEVTGLRTVHRYGCDGWGDLKSRIFLCILLRDRNYINYITVPADLRFPVRSG